MKRRFLRNAVIATAFAAGIFTASAQAKIDLVTLPQSDSTQLTIYNSADLTLVRQTRTMSFSEGENEIQFSWANTLIDPTSLHIDIQSAPGVEVIDAVYPANTKDLIVWNIAADEDTSGEVKITYFTSGLTWSSDYIIKANNEQTEFDLQQFVTVQNNSGEDFVDAETRVVVGEVNLLDMIADLAQRGIHLGERERRQLGRSVLAEMTQREDADEALAAPSAFGGMMKDAKEIVTQAVSEYYLMSIEGKETIENGWSKRLPKPVISDIPFELSYEIDPRKYGPQVVKVYKLVNDEKHELGKEPLPDGIYYVYKDDGRDGTSFEGNTNHKYVPVGEDIELMLGEDGMVIYEERLIEFERRNFDFSSTGNVIGWQEVKTMELELKNTRDRSVPVKLTHYLNGDWEFDQVSDDYEKLGVDSVRWEISVPANDKKIITYKVVVNQGTLANRN